MSVSSDYSDAIDALETLAASASAASADNAPTTNSPGDAFKQATADLAGEAAAQALGILHASGDRAAGRLASAGL